MGFLAPTLLLLGLGIAVPLVLHLLHRRKGRRVVFPALRYLRRAEREHARRIKLRQLLLLALRLAVILLLAAAAARLFLRSGADIHEPTAVAIVLDNSLSSGLVLDDRTALDELKARALETLARAGDEDRFWLIRAGSPWDPAPPGDARETAARVEATEVSAAAADLGAALARARALLAAGAEGRAQEIHLLSDLQATALQDLATAAGTGPLVVVWAPRGTPPPNAAVTAVEVGGGLAPRAGERSVVTARITGVEEGDSVPVRLVVDGRVSAAARVPATGDVALPFPARAAGIVTGWVEIDPDALRTDDRRYFAVRVQPPPAVGLAAPLPFVDEAIEVLTDAGRVQAAEGAADLVLAPAGVGSEALRDGRATVIIAPESPLELPAANRRLAAAQVPWRFEPAPGGGEARLEADALDDGLAAMADVRIRRFHVLEPQGAAATADSVLLRLRDGSPWAVRGELANGARYVLLASSLSPDASTLPTAPAMLLFLDRLIGSWIAAEPARAGVRAGDPVDLPAGADNVERPDGTRQRIYPGSEFLAPGRAGIYRVYQGDRLVDAFAVNPDPRESRLERADPRELAAALPGWTVATARSAGEWERTIFHQRHGRELWRPLLLLVVALLLVEGLVAAAGRSRPAGGREPARSPAAPELATRDAEPAGSERHGRAPVSAEREEAGRI